MKYYAVANDPAELMHYGIKGMKWGVIRTDAQLGHFKPARSRAYRRASAKLSKMMRNGIQKAEADWKTYNSPANKAARQQKRDINKAIRQNKRNEKLFEKHVQLAREGRLKYKGISDAEVQRITDRLNLERQARFLSGTEKQSFGRRLRESVGEGVIRGVGQGTSSYIDARMRGRGQATADIKSKQRMAKYKDSIRGRIAENQEARAENRKMRRDVAREADREYYKMAEEQGLPTGLISGIANSKVNVDAWGRPTGVSLSNNLTRSGRARAVRQYKQAQEKSEHKQKLQYLEDEEQVRAKFKKDKQKNKESGGGLSEKDVKRLIQESSSNKKNSDSTSPTVVVNVGGVGRRYSPNSSVTYTQGSGNRYMRKRAGSRVKRG